MRFQAAKKLSIREEIKEKIKKEEVKVNNHHSAFIATQKIKSLPKINPKINKPKSPSSGKSKISKVTAQEIPEIEFDITSKSMELIFQPNENIEPHKPHKEIKPQPVSRTKHKNVSSVPKNSSKQIESALNNKVSKSLPAIIDSGEAISPPVKLQLKDETKPGNTCCKLFDKKIILAAGALAGIAILSYGSTF